MYRNISDGSATSTACWASFPSRPGPCGRLRCGNLAWNHGNRTSDSAHPSLVTAKRGAAFQPIGRVKERSGGAPGDILTLA